MIHNRSSFRSLRWTPGKGIGCDARSGFTLIELLVVVSIIVILLTMTVMAVKFTTDADRVRGAAGQVQSFLAGARDRAIYSKEPRGVRFFVSPENPRAVTTMAYIAPGGTWSSPENSGNVRLERIDGNKDGDFDDDVDLVTRVHGTQNPGWWNLKRRGWLVDGLRIRIPKGPTGNWYPIDTRLIDVTVAPTSDQVLLLQIPYADGGNKGQFVAHENTTYEIELPAKLLAQDPAILPDSVVIDLDGSKIPDGWRPQVPQNGLQYSGYMDLIFSPRGSIIGDAAGAGVIHLYVGDAEDSLFLKERFESQFGTRPAYTSDKPFVPMDEISKTTWVGTENDYKTKDRRIISVFTQTGAISIHEVNGFFSEASLAAGDVQDPFDYNGNGNFLEPDGLADDPYYFAETGKVAK
jgi:prepilin-type N-terminal cleavage/methylation domain-containing protein